MKNSLISIIIPVYNVEKHIAKCIQSLLDQTYENFEAIIVDDGSPDNSIKIAKELAGNDSRFIFLEKENGGQGSARNMGIDYSKGLYLAFLDSDDYIESQYLEKTYEQMIEGNADICTCDVNVIEDNAISYIIKNNVDEYYSKNDFLLCLGTVTSFMWDKLFKKELFDGMRFDESIRTYEDSHFVFRLIFNKKIVSINQPLYNYVQRDGSTTRSIPKTYLKDKKSVMDTYIKFNKELNGVEAYIARCYLVNYIFTCAVDLARFSKEFDKDIEVLKKNLDYSYISFGNIVRLIRYDFKKSLGLFFLFISPNTFKYLVVNKLS